MQILNLSNWNWDTFVSGARLTTSVGGAGVVADVAGGVVAVVDDAGGFSLEASTLSMKLMAAYSTTTANTKEKHKMTK